MNVVLVNTDLCTDDSFRELAKLLKGGDLFVYAYREQGPETLQLQGGEIRLGGGASFDINSIGALVAVSPGFMTLKFVHDLIASYIKKGSTSTHIGLSLPEFWMVQKLEFVDPFRFEAFYTYVSSCQSVGYPSMSMTCVSEACSDYYARAMLGGYRPRPLPLHGVMTEFGIHPHVPMGLG